MKKQTFLKKWENETKLVSDEITLAFKILSSVKKKNVQSVFVDSLLLHAQNKSKDEHAYLSKLKNNLSKIGCFDPNVKMIFFPLFNEEKSHWSISIYSVAEKTIIHYDSIKDTNFEQFNFLVEKISLINLLKNDVKVQQNPKWFSQRNEWDCGFFIIFALWACLFNEKLVISDYLVRIKNEKELYDSISDMVKLIDAYNVQQEDSEDDEVPQKQEEEEPPKKETVVKIEKHKPNNPEIEKPAVEKKRKVVSEKPQKKKKPVEEKTE